MGKLLYHINMSSYIIGLYLVIIALLPVTIRSFTPKVFSKNQKKDSLAILPIILLGVCFLLFCGFGSTFSMIIIMVFTVVVFITNMKCFINLCVGLNKDYFGYTIKIISILETIGIVIFIIFSIIYFPSYIIVDKQEITRYYGTDYSGYKVKDEVFEKTSAQKIVYENENVTEYDSAVNVLFIPDIYVSVHDCIGNLTNLAKKGYKVSSFSFINSKLHYFNNYKDSYCFENFSLRKEKKNNPKKILENEELFVNSKLREFTSALKIMEKEGNTPVFIIAEGNCVLAAKLLKQNFPDLVKGIYSINDDIDKYSNYTLGYGNLQQTRPFESKCLGLKRDKTWDNAIKIAYNADKYFQNWVNLELENEMEK